MASEKWLPVPGFEGLYEVSSHGRVQKIAPWCDGVNHYATRLLPVDRTRSGHLRVQLCTNGRKKRTSVHQLVMLAFVRPPEIGEVVNHKDGDPARKRAENLEYTTERGNTLHARDVLGRKFGLKGTQHSHAKFTDADSITIRHERKRGATLKALADHYQVSQSTISQIARHRIWQHTIGKGEHPMKAHTIHPDH